MKYKLINIETKETHLCEKIEIDGFDYYLGEVVQLNGENLKHQEFYIEHTQIKPNIYCLFKNTSMIDDYGFENCFKIFATNNPNIDCAKVVDEVKIKLNSILQSDEGLYSMIDNLSFKVGFNKAKETHPFSEEDIIEFYKWVNQPHPEDNRQPSAVYVKNINMWWYNHKKYTSKELLQLWKEQKIKTIYFN